MTINNYNNFLALAYSYCPKEKCDSDNDDHYSALIIFSYPNSIDTTLNLEDYLLISNNTDIKNLEIDLKTQINLENNIFGYVLSKIAIKLISGPLYEYKAYSSNNINEEIIENYNLEENENIIFKYTGTEDHLTTINKTIEYNFIVTESDYIIYESYINEIEGDDDTDYFKKEEYIGKYTYYYIKSENEFSFVCNDPNCNICF